MTSVRFPVADARGNVSWADVPVTVPRSGPDGYVPGAGPQLALVGPTGRWPDHTPPYNTPATIFINSVDNLNTALNGASGGDVIEVANPGGGSAITITNSPSGQGNVLVRPPLGQRGMILKNAAFRFGNQSSSSTSGPSRITLAGFTINDWLDWNQCNDCHVVWCESGPRQMTMRGPRNCSMVEVVRRDRNPNSDSGAGYFLRNHANRQMRDFQFIGCWLTGGESWKNNMIYNQVPGSTPPEGHTIQGVRFSHSVLETGWDKCIESNAHVDGLVMENCWFNNVLTADENNGGDYDWSLTVGSGGRPTFNNACINQYAYDGVVRDCIILGAFRLQSGDCVLSTSVVRSVSDNVQWPDQTSDLTKVGLTVDPNVSELTHPKPAAPSSSLLDSVWHP